MWTINLIKNTVKIPKECLEDLYNELIEGNHYEDLPQLEYDRKANKELLPFNSDNFEHMDHIKLTSEVLKKYKVQGDVIFADFDGDGFNRKDVSKSFWGYRFDGNGGMKKLEAILTFEEK